MTASEQIARAAAKQICDAMCNNDDFNVDPDAVPIILCYITPLVEQRDKMKAALKDLWYAGRVSWGPERPMVKVAGQLIAECEKAKP